MQQVAFIKTQDGNISLILGTKNFSISTTHPNYVQIIEALKSKAYDTLETLVDIPKAIQNGFKGVLVQDGQVFWNGNVLHNVVTQRILDFLRDGLPTEPLMRFLENLMQNPMPAAVNELYDFLDHKGFPITEDGCFIGYKGVREDWLDQHSGTVDNSVGKVIEMPRENVDPDRRQECSYGYHVGTLEYARTFAARTLLVKVNPADCVAVPMDHNCSKLRVCKYEVVGEATGLIETPMYAYNVVHDEGPEPEDENENWDSEDDQDEDGDEFWNSDDDDQDEVDAEDDTVTTTTVVEDKAATVTTVTVVTKIPKRAPCAHCGAKGGKKHDRKCQRPTK